VVTIPAALPLVLREQQLSIPQAAARFRVTPPTVRRWQTIGVKGPGGVLVSLETAKKGWRWVTSAEACDRFLAALNPEPVALERTPTARRRASERAEAQLIRMGC